MPSQFCLATPRQDNMVGEEGEATLLSSILYLCQLPLLRFPRFLWCLQLIYGRHLGQGMGQRQGQLTSAPGGPTERESPKVATQAATGWAVCRGCGLNQPWVTSHLGANNGVLSRD